MLINFFRFPADIDIVHKNLKYCWKLRHNIDEEIPITSGSNTSEMDHQSFTEAVNPISDNDNSLKTM